MAGYGCTSKYRELQPAAIALPEKYMLTDAHGWIPAEYKLREDVPRRLTVRGVGYIRAADSRRLD